jgi:hypothetical protein
MVFIGPRWTIDATSVAGREYVSKPGTEPLGTAYPAVTWTSAVAVGT